MSLFKIRMVRKHALYFFIIQIQCAYCCLATRLRMRFQTNVQVKDIYLFAADETPHGKFTYLQASLYISHVVSYWCSVIGLNLLSRCITLLHLSHNHFQLMSIVSYIKISIRVRVHY